MRRFTDKVFLILLGVLFVFGLVAYYNLSQQVKTVYRVAHPRPLSTETTIVVEYLSYSGEKVFHDDVLTLREFVESEGIWGEESVEELAFRIDRGVAEGRSLDVVLHEWADGREYGEFGGK